MSPASSRKLSGVTGLASAVPPRALLLTLLALVSLLALAGLQQLRVEAPALGAFELDGEGTVPAYFSGALSLAAAVVAWAHATQEHAGRLRVALIGLGALLAFMAIDEAAALHENVDVWFGIDNWQVAYLPIALLGAVAWAGVLRLLAAGPVVTRLLVGGAAAWLVAQLLEAPLQAGYGGRVPLVHWLPLPEETLEMIGSACFLLALHLALRARLSGGTST